MNTTIPVANLNPPTLRLEDVQSFLARLAHEKGVAEVPMFFTTPRLCVNRTGLIEMLGLQHHTESGARKAAGRFLKRHHIRALPGRVYPVKAIERAIDCDARWKAKTRE